jgi:hypothetical protein
MHFLKRWHTACGNLILFPNHILQGFCGTTLDEGNNNMKVTMGKKKKEKRIS